MSKLIRQADDKFAYLSTDIVCDPHTPHIIHNTYTHKPPTHSSSLEYLVVPPPPPPPGKSWRTLGEENGVDYTCTMSNVHPK